MRWTLIASQEHLVPRSNLGPLISLLPASLGSGCEWPSPPTPTLGLSPPPSLSRLAVLLFLRGFLQ